MAYDQIWLTGFMGTGKSRVARPLAAALDWRPLDIDALIEEEAGERISDIFAHGGETAFRIVESRVITRVSDMSQIVVATGGGSILAVGNRLLMKQRGYIVCLDAQPETIAMRLRDSGRHQSERPLLGADDPLARIVELKAARQALYEEADLVIATDTLTPDQVTHAILTAFRERTAVSPAP